MTGEPEMRKPRIFYRGGIWHCEQARIAEGETGIARFNLAALAFCGRLNHGYIVTVL